MTDLRERFRALDVLEVPDVLSRARSIGPRPPDPEPTPQGQRAAAYVLAAVIVILALIVIVRAMDRSGVPADDPTPTTAPTPIESVQRRDGEILQYRGTLVAVDPQTGATRVIVAASGVPSGSRIDNAAWSADGRWVAFDVRGCNPDVPNAGLWVSDALGAERRILDRPCGPDSFAVNELWAWSPTTAQLGVQRGSADGDSLLLIDAGTGEVTDLGPVEGDLNTLTWSPDGTRITYNSGRSISSVSVVDGTTSVLVDDLGYVYGIGGSGIHWSPDGEQLTIAVNAEAGPTRLYFMEADGSNLRAISASVQDAAWAPDGTRLAYATFTGAPNERILRIWTLAPDDPMPVLVHEGPSHTSLETADLAWSPDGTRIAFATDTAGEPERIVHQVVDADDSGGARDVDELVHLSWRDGSYFCGCYG